jgi:molybdopterin molybdotransferase
VEDHRHNEGFKHLTRIDDALQIFFEALGKPTIRFQNVPVTKALGRIVAEDIGASQSLPPTDRSVMDGYAVRSEDVRDANDQTPAILKLSGESKLGELCKATVNPGTGVAVATGSMIPPGADTVVIVERTKPMPGGKIAVYAPAGPWQSISKRGEDVSPGRLVLTRGHRLLPHDLGILKALGFSKVRVVRKPVISLISTGNELADFLKKGEFWKIVDINRVVLAGMVERLGAEPLDLGIVKDREGSILRAIRKGLRISDVVVVTAGSSVGKRDLVPECVNRLGKPGMLVHGIAMRPSMPTGLGVVNGKPILSLPGFPVSAIFAFRAFGRPLIARLLGTREPEELVLKAILKERISGPTGYRTFVRVVVESSDDGLIAKPLMLQRSSALMSMVAANGIVTIPENVTAFEAGQLVDVTLIGDVPS